MFGLGTLINTGAVIAGGLLGITLKKGIPERCREVLMQACGVSTIFIGAGGVMSKMLTFTDGTLETQGTMLLIFSMIIGSLIGSLLDIEQRLEELGEFLKRKFHTENDSLFVEGFVTSTLVICIGKGVIFSALPLFLYQGAITCLAAIAGNFMSTELICQLSYVGSALIFCVGVNIAFGKKFAVGNMLPALLIPIVYSIATSFM